MRLKGKGIAGGDMLVSPYIVLSDPDDAALKDWAAQASGDFNPREALQG